MFEAIKAYANYFKRKVSLIKDEWAFASSNQASMQLNDRDCGVFLFFYSKLVVEDGEIETVQTDASLARKSLFTMLMEQHFCRMSNRR